MRQLDIDDIKKQEDFAFKFIELAVKELELMESDGCKYKYSYVDGDKYSISITVKKVVE